MEERAAVADRGEVLGQTSGDKLSAVTVMAGTWTRGSDGVLG